MSREARLRESLVIHGRSLHERGLSPGLSGNLILTGEQVADLEQAFPS